MKQKIINNLNLKGRKEVSEILFSKTFKELQKNSFKQSRHLINVALISSIPIFKIHKMVKKGKKKRIREIPMILRSKKIRIFTSIKWILNILKNKNLGNFYSKLYKEIMLNAKKEGDSALLKNKIQKEALLKKHFFYYYRWK